MRILGIETSCDETAASVVEDGRKVLSAVVSSSLRFHQKYGGIIPEIAFRKQLETICQIADCAIKESGVQLRNIDAVAVTREPGLKGSLLVGLSFAGALAECLKVPLININHLYGHLYSPFLNKDSAAKLPAIGLVVSGGHTSLYYVRSFADIELLGSTQDDACGEAFDKVAKILGLGYPGGPVIEKKAADGNPKAIRFTCSNTQKPLNFSYSGIKTAVLYFARQNKLGTFAKTHSAGAKKTISDVCASFQESALNVLVEKTISACRLKRVKSVIVGGGVAANGVLRNKFVSAAKKHGLNVAFPSKENCMDNAAMIAGLAYHKRKRGTL
ncbi:MAG: tRNA (adenosine(37)-N6)-threonylcarbamoyltransferase complex transferase subunit TsaD [Candidatus Omnitrophica bacterium]|nr:tRNA (adenosine(37)-N6)-threonylcarbamoyltransferase complex transferase subunit TsaD [Candidatus Omnitrophota bacterium]